MLLHLIEKRMIEERDQTVARNDNPKSAPIRYQSIRQTDIPRSRQGKHTQIVEQLLRHLDELDPGTALKVALASLPATKANIRSALNRATHKKGLRVATSSDARHFYLWKATGKS
jgi:hypothetical protein